MVNNTHKFNYKWYLKDGYPAPGIDKNNYKVFSSFACGGGSTMGYKLAGYDVVGMNEIDKKMFDTYCINHHPKHAYNEDIRTFRTREDLPEELFNLDILDGSPPCSSFSMAGNREKDWGKEKKFREGQQEQVLDNLFFEFIALAKRLQPKIVIAENVKGILLGEAIQYVKQIRDDFDKAGYYVEKWLLNASIMGVPQRRERVFFIAMRKDLSDTFHDKIDMFNPLPYIAMEFNEPQICFKEISQNSKEFTKPEWVDIWNKMQQGDSLEKFVGYGFNTIKIYENKSMPTIAGTQRKNSFKSAGLIHPTQCRKLNDKEFCLGGTFPVDYDFSKGIGNANFTGYIIGMSVPPVMMAQIALRVREQYLDVLSGRR